jgi:predicted nucleic acid-binding Zn ribbon protein
VRIDFSNKRTTESAGYALMKTHAAATRFAATAARVDGGSLFQVRAVAVGRFAVAVTATTSAGASALLQLALAHLKRSES